MVSVEGRNVCVIGLGSMGLGMAASLLRDGFTVCGFDLNPEPLARFVALGGSAATSPAVAASAADIVIAVVVNAAQTAEVFFGNDGAAGTMVRGGTLISCATMSPEAARGFEAQANQQGLRYLDAPISGGAARAATGDLTILASGDPAAFTHVRPLLKSLAAKVYELGDKAGVGAAFKIVNQLLAGVHIAAACEAITFAKAMDLDLARVYEVITASAGNSWMFENRIPHVLEGDYAPRSAIDIFTKDLGIVADIGRGLKFPTPVASMALQMFVMTAAAGMGREDDASVARMIARLAGLKLPGMED